jgi:tRNA(fMet)-specific endonuclease VapC
MKMTGNKFLLDTNIISAWLKGESSVADKIDKAKEIHIPIIAVGELYYGAMYSTRVEKNIADITKITATYNLLLIDEAITLVYGKIKAALKKKGKPIPENDIWIAAIAEYYSLVLVSRDKHFKEIDTVKVKDWK